MHIPKLHVVKSKHFKWHELTFSHKKEKDNKRPDTTHKHSKKRLLLLSQMWTLMIITFIEWQQLNANLIHCLKNNMQK